MIKIPSEMKTLIYDLLWVDYGEYQGVNDEISVDQVHQLKSFCEQLIYNYRSQDNENEQLQPHA